jgi:phosphate transport system protein
MTDTPHRDRHTLSAYDAELDELRALISEMGGAVEVALQRALDALLAHDRDSARAVIEADKAVDAMERRAGQLVASLIVRRAPVADDLREVLAAYRTAGAIERVGDYAKTVAKRMPDEDLTDATEPMRLLKTLGDGVRELLRAALDAFAARDAQAAQLVCARDKEIDDLYNSLFLALLAQMMKEPRDVPAYSQLLIIAKSLERVGDQATNLAELVYFARLGDQLPDRHG